MKITEGRVRLAASDVANFLACRRLTQLDLAEGAGGTAAAARVRHRVPGPGPARGGARAGRAGAVPRGGAGRRGRQRGGGYPGRGRGDGRGHPGRRRGRLPGDAGRRRPAGRRCSGGRISWCGRTCCLRRTGSRGRTGFTTRSWTPSWPGPRRPAPCCRPRSTRTCSPTCRGSRRGGCTWRWATGSSPRSRWTTLPPTSGRRGGCWRRIARSAAGTRRPRSTRSRSSTVRSAGGAICAASAGEPTTTCRWWPG